MCLRGIWAFHGDHAPHGDRLPQARRGGAVVKVVVDTPERIFRCFDVIGDGLVTSEAVPAAPAG